VSEPARPPTELYTVIVVSDHSQAVRKFRLPRAWLERGLWVGGLAALGALGAAVHYFSLLGSASENRVLKEENAQLRSQILLVQEKVAHISAILDRVDRFDAKLRTAVGQLQDPEKNQAPAPPDEPGGPTVLGGVPAPVPGAAPADGAPARGPEGGPGGVRPPPENPGPSLASTPAAWPARGWLTSEFGVCVDPYSSERTMHRGVDIAAPHGAPVSAPADGMVVFSGVEGGQGKVLIIDHGYGVRTRYGHLSEVFVAPGDRVKRGTKVASVGNTGRSTGPHLHYEVTVNGIPESPRHFVQE